MSYTPIVPAVIPHSADEVKKHAADLSFSREFHLDVVDGKFLPTSSWPYEPVGEPLSVKPQLDAYTLEVDLMVEQPLIAAEKWVAAGVDMLVFHVETLPKEVFANFSQETNVSVGISFNGHTSMETFEAYLPFADYVQLMGIYEIGQQGQPLDEAVFEKISYIKHHYPMLSITVDGSVNEHTIERLKKAGADRFIVGSAIALQENPHAAYQSLTALING
jgi:pentose-5-phosphate-3-epimerase